MENLKNTLLLTDTSVLKTAIATVLLSKVVKEVSYNKEHYTDILKLDFKSYSIDKNYGLHYWDLAPEIGYWLCDIYEELNMPYEKIFNILNMEKTFSITHSPLQVKYVVEYIKKYGNEYKKINKITKQELMNPLSDQEKQKIKLLFK
jgi:hypothetical protein